MTPGRQGIRHELARLQQLVNLLRLQGFEHHRIAEHRAHLGVALHHRAHRVRRAHHDQMQAVLQQGLIAGATLGGVKYTRIIP
jgi:hypothetical protein